MIKSNIKTENSPFIGCFWPFIGFSSAAIYTLVYFGHEQKTHNRFHASRATDHCDRGWRASFIRHRQSQRVHTQQPNDEYRQRSAFQFLTGSLHFGPSEKQYHNLLERQFNG